MPVMTRRAVLAAVPASVVACGEIAVLSQDEINASVAASRRLMFETVPWSRDLASRASGILIIPEIVEGGFVISAAYGEGALLIGDAPVDYISMTSAAFGFQIGAQAFSHALFFMTPDVLREFRVTDGWELGADAEFAVPDQGIGAGISSNTVGRPVVALIYGQRGLIAGASLEGTKYSRLIR
ncbi:MAG: YSC84-related protein [Pseudomonadota bacterium]